MSSDRHWDSPHSNHALQKKHLDQAMERGAAILDLGDALDLMGGKYDPRSQKGSIRPEHHVPHYFDAVVSDAAKFFEPYAHNIVMMAQGNHETAMLRRHEFCPTQRLAGLLNVTTGSNIHNGKYSGWVTFAFGLPTKGKQRTTTLTCNYHHGISSGSPASNISAMEKYAGTVPDADIVITGHAHNSLSHQIARMRLGLNGYTYQDTQLLLMCPSYKDGVGDYSEGWEVEKVFRPKPLGAHWIRFFWDPKLERVGCESIRAQ